jgi:hypothetical protein
MSRAAVEAEPQQPDALEEEDSGLMGEESEAEDDGGFETYQTEMGELGDQDLDGGDGEEDDDGEIEKGTQLLLQIRVSDAS